MRVIFFGTSDIAASALNTLLLSRHEVLAVVTAADKRQGRGQRVGLSPVKLIAQKKGLSLLQSEDLRDSEFIRALKKPLADLFVVCAYGKILTKEVLQIPKEFAINLHTSLLPKYRGAAPINWAIVNGEGMSGVTVFKMDEGMDSGEIILQEKEAISSCDTAVSLAEKLSRIGGRALVEAIDLIEQGKATFSKQDETKSSAAPKLKKEDGLINWDLPALEIYNRIRGFVPWPGAFTYFENRLLKIWKGEVIQAKDEGMPGQILDIDNKRGILVQAGKDRLLITVLQLEGKKRMPATEFILGHDVMPGIKLGNDK